METCTIRNAENMIMYDEEMAVNLERGDNGNVYDRQKTEMQKP